MKQPEVYNLYNKLHTEMLEEKHSKIDVQVLFDNDNIREVLLVNEEHIANTYAITMKNKQWRQSAEICAINLAIQNGEAIGRAFKSRGFTIQKNVLDVFTIQLPDWLQIAFEATTATAKARMMEFIVKKQNSIYNYGIITEIYSPAFTKPEVSIADEIQINIPSASMLKLGFTADELWLSLEKDVFTRQAKIYSPEVKQIRKRINEIMMEALPLLAI